jgi:hypothetical protein
LSLTWLSLTRLSLTRLTLTRLTLSRLTLSGLTLAALTLSLCPLLDLSLSRLRTGLRQLLHRLLQIAGCARDLLSHFSRHG